MNRQLQFILQLYLKKILLTLLVIGSVFLMYRTYSAFFEKVNYVWQKKYQYNYAELLLLAKHRLEEAVFNVEFHCNRPSLFKVENEVSEECKRARQEYEVALKNYQEVMKRKDEILNVEKNVRDYYMAIARSAKMYPLPALLFVFSLIAFIALSYIFIREIFLNKKEKKIEV